MKKEHVNKIKFSEYDTAYIITHYCLGFTYQELADLYGCSTETIRRLLKRNDIRLHSKAETCNLRKKTLTLIIK